MKTKQSISLLILATGLTVLPACKTSMNTVERAEPRGQRQMVDDQRIITDGSLNRTVQIVGVNEALTNGGVLRVQVELRNRTRSAKRYLYEFEWFDADGMQVSPTSSGTRQDQIEAGEYKFISAVAPTPNCQDFRLKLLEAK